MEVLEAERLEVKYGLPAEVKFCKKCVISNQRPNSTVEFKHTIESKKQTIHLDAEGVCDACRVAEQKVNIDWQSREAALEELCNKHRGDGTYYDCLV
ncbi:MAG TPA: N-acetyl sugar amidotransferase, partial [Candidatus Berkiella sp.]|nr:N-acetyl sugar amidotransferase [Candidatus Berkiella sp.]